MNNIKKRQLIFFAIWLGVLFSQSYSITGIVLDTESNQPINNVNIYIKNSDIGTITDHQGSFTLYLNNQLGSSIDLNIKMIGYKEQSLQFNLSQSKIDLGKIFLIVESLELESIHIHSHKNKTNQISVISLSGEKLNNNRTGNIATTLSNQPNIGVHSFGSATSKPVLRGYSGDRFLLTKDGNKIGDLSQSSIDHAITLDMMEVGSVEIIRGPESLVYGANAIGGVINTSMIGNPKVRVNKFFKKFLFGGESFDNSIHGNMIFYFPINNSQINMFLSNRDTENQTSPIGELKNTESTTSDYKVGFTKYNQDGYINFIIENFNMDYGIPPSSEGHINGVAIELIKNTFQANYHRDILFYNFHQFDIKYNFVDYEHKEFESTSDYIAVILSQKLHNFKIEIQSFNTIIGSELNYKKFDPSGYYWTPETNELDFSIYGFHEKEFDSFDLLSSFRMGLLSIKPKRNNRSFANLNVEDVRNRDFKYFSSSLGIIKYIDKFEINSWLMQTMRGPKVEDLYSDGPHLGIYSYEIGFPDLELERIYGIESSIKYNTNPLNISLITFYNYSPYYYQMSKMGECQEEYVFGKSHPCRGADFIAWGKGPFRFLYKYQAKGVESIIKGLEFNLNYGYQNFKIIYDYSLVRGNDLTNSIPLPYINPDKQMITLDYEIGLMNYKLRSTYIYPQNRLGEFESYTPSSFLVDLVLGYNKKNHNVTIQFNNIFNKEYYNHLSKIKSIMPEAGRNIKFFYKVFF